MTVHIRRSVIGALAAVCGLGLLSATPAQSYEPSPDPANPGIVSPIPRAPLCSRPLSRLELYRDSSRFVLPGTLTILNETVPVDLDTFSLGQRPFADPSRMLWYRSLLWLAVAAVDEHEHGRLGRAATAARAMLRAAWAWPDPGSATPERLRWANAIGWDEGTTFRRAEALLCLASITGAQRVRPLLMQHARAMLDPNRYYGPPQRRVHNHGMLTNLVLLDIAAVLREPSLRARAIARLVNDYGSAFSVGGWARESSSSYQSVNINGWREVYFDLARRGLVADANVLGQRLAAATTLAAHLLSPTGRPALIGNSRPTDDVLRPGPESRPLTVVDTDGGFAAGRWSWTDRRSSWWTLTNRERRGSHGHWDALALNWQAQAAPVLIDPGQPDYDVTNPMSEWMKTPQAHNRPVPVRVRRDRRKVRTIALRRFGTIDRILAESTDQGPLQRREVVLDDGRGALQVNDRSGGRQVQHWHLDARWRPALQTPARAVFTAGRKTLTVTTDGADLTVTTGASNPFAGWQTIGFEQQVAAPEIMIRGGKDIQTTFQLSRRAPVLPPVPVIDKRTSKTGPGTVFLRWAPTDPDTGKPAPRGTRFPSIVGYRIQQLVPGEGWVTVRTDTGSRRLKARLGRLTNGVKYRFRVAALTARAAGAYGPRSKPLVPGATDDGDDKHARAAS